jgi:hypothetical protein
VTNFQTGGQILFLIMLRPILLKSVASFFIWYLIVPCYLFWDSDTDVKQTTRKSVQEEMWVNIRQAACCCVYTYVHCCRHFTHQMDSCGHYMHTVLIYVRCVL